MHWVRVITGELLPIAYFVAMHAVLLNVADKADTTLPNNQILPSVATGTAAVKGVKLRRCTRSQQMFCQLKRDA